MSSQTELGLDPTLPLPAYPSSKTHEVIGGVQTPSSPEILLSPFPSILLCRTFWNGASLRGSPQCQLAKGLSFWPGERCPTEGSKHTVEFRPHPFCQFAYKLA